MRLGFLHTTIMTVKSAQILELWLCVARDAWNSLGYMTKEEAMKNYIEDIQLVSPFRNKIKLHCVNVRCYKRLT